MKVIQTKKEKRYEFDNNDSVEKVVGVVQLELNRLIAQTIFEEVEKEIKTDMEKDL